MITEIDVLASYKKYVGLVVRRMMIEQTRSETELEFEERVQATADHDLLELQYIAQFT